MCVQRKDAGDSVSLCKVEADNSRQVVTHRCTGNQDKKVDLLKQDSSVHTCTRSKTDGKDNGRESEGETSKSHVTHVLSQPWSDGEGSAALR